jgi:DNA helicase IV
VDDLDDGHDEVKKYKSLSHGPQPVQEKLQGLEAVMPRAVELLTGGEGATCVIAPQKAVRDQLRKYFAGKGLATRVIEANEKDSHESPGIRFSTMHRAKGLEFNQVVVVARQEELTTGDQYRKLVYVALTRAKREAALLLY